MIMRIYTPVLLLLLLSSCLKIEYHPFSVNKTPASCSFCVDDIRYVQMPGRKVIWRNSAYETGHNWIMMRVDFTCEAEINPVSWLGTDENGYELCLGPALWFSIHDDIKEGETFTQFNYDNAFAITKKVIVKEGEKEHYSFYAYYDLVRFKTMVVSCITNNDKEISLNFSGTLDYGPEGDKRTIRIENGYIRLDRGSQNGPFTSREEWTKSRDQLLYWL